MCKLWLRWVFGGQRVSSEREKLELVVASGVWVAVGVAGVAGGGLRYLVSCCMLLMAGFCCLLCAGAGGWLAQPSCWLWRVMVVCVWGRVAVSSVRVVACCC